MPRVVVLEGPDGSGKSHHADSLASLLRQRGHRALAFHHHMREPGDHWGAALDFALQRNLVLKVRHDDPNLFLVADRWAESTLVVSYTLRGSVEAGHLKQALNSLYHAEIARLPDPFVRFYLDAPNPVLDERIGLRTKEPPTLFDLQKREAARRVFEPLRGLHCQRINTTGDSIEVSRVMLTHLLGLLNQEST